MSKNLKIFLGISYLIILFAFLYFIFSGIEVDRLNDFSYYKQLQKDLRDYISDNIITNLIYFLGFSCILWAAFFNPSCATLLFFSFH